MSAAPGQPVPAACGDWAATKAAYQREMDVCNRKYRNESGTMYRSFTAFCRAEIAQRYSRQALKAKR